MSGERNRTKSSHRAEPHRAAQDCDLTNTSNEVPLFVLSGYLKKRLHFIYPHLTALTSAALNASYVLTSIMASISIYPVLLISLLQEKLEMSPTAHMRITL